MSDTSLSAAGASAYRRGLALVFLGSLCSSWIGLGVRLTEEASAWQILVFRSLGMAIFILLFLVLRNPGCLASAFHKAGLPALIGAIGLTAASCGIIVAIQHASVANAMFLLAAAPFVAAVLGRIVLKERVRPGTWIAVFVAFAGVGIMVAEGISFGFAWGNLAGLVAALGMASFVTALRFGRLNDMLPLSVIAGIFSLALAGTMSFVTGDGLAVSLHDALIGLALGVFQLAAALLFITRGSRTVSAAEVALISLTEVVLAPLWVWLAFGETAGLFTLIGGALVLGAIAGDAIAGLRNRRRPAVAMGPTVGEV